MNFIARLILLLAWFSGVCLAQSHAPNLIIITTDDQGYCDVGFNGCKDIPTPNLDSIASNGVRFTSGYVSSTISSPSRAGLLTGRYQEFFGYESDDHFQPKNPRAGLPLGETTLADALHQVGYHSALIGKWHLGTHPKFHPLKRGFDEYFGFIGFASAYFPQELTNTSFNSIRYDYESYNLQIFRNNEMIAVTNYLTDEFSDEAVRVIERNKERPFFLLLNYNAPHPPLEAPAEYLARFPNMDGQGRKTYAAMMSAVDDGVGRILKKLRAENLETNTLVVFLSCNGGPLNQNYSDNFPLRGYKFSSWEGGWRVPFALQWRGHLPAGKVYDRPVLSLDIFATMAALASVPISSNKPLDGVNLIPYLTGENTGSPHETIFLRLPDIGAYAVRSGDYKLLFPGTNQLPEQQRLRLYNLNQDISESRNLADTETNIVAQLQNKLTEWNRQISAATASPGAKAKE